MTFRPTFQSANYCATVVIAVIVTITGTRIMSIIMMIIISTNIELRGLHQGSKFYGTHCLNTGNLQVCRFFMNTCVQIHCPVVYSRVFHNYSCSDPDSAETWTRQVFDHDARPDPDVVLLYTAGSPPSFVSDP